MNQKESNDSQQILDHIHSIFQAFLRQDREALRKAHSDDWIGFMGPSTAIERGIDAYMANAEKSLQNFKGIAYKILDHEIQIYQDIALVYYVAQYDYKEADGAVHSIPLRSVDIYRRESDDWIQAGSHITVIPSEGAWGEGNSK